MSSKKYQKKLQNWIERPSDPIMLDSFGGDMQKAVMFYSAQVDRLYLANYLLQTQLKATQQQKKELKAQITQMQRNQKNSSQQQKKRRHRRCASEIARQYICQAPRCGKSYGSQGSLSQHMKLKHPQMMAQEQKNNDNKKQEVKVKKRQKILLINNGGNISQQSQQQNSSQSSSQNQDQQEKQNINSQQSISQREQ